MKLTNEATRVVNTTTTNAAGQYLFEHLTVGVYDIAVNQAGFKAFSITGIKVDANARLRADVALEVGAVQENVTVEATPSPVQTTEGTVSSVITTEQINTAVINGRNYARLAMLMPGAVYQSGSDELSGAGLNAPGSPVSINGLNNKSAGWFVDGAYDMNVGNGEANPRIPVLDTLQEIQVQTSNYSAKYGTTGGAVINAVTKSGTSAFHGNAYEYFRNDKMDARNFFSPTVVPLKQNEFGSASAGPSSCRTITRTETRPSSSGTRTGATAAARLPSPRPRPPLRCAPAISLRKPPASRNPFSTRAPGSHSPAT